MTVKEKYEQVKRELEKQRTSGIFLFRLTGYYEAFYEDAERLNKEVPEVNLSYRLGIPQAGFQVHEDWVIQKLIDKGLNVFIHDNGKTRAA